MRLILFAALCWTFGAHAQPMPLPCPPKDIDCAREASLTHPVRQPEFWKAALAKPLAERIGAAPPEMIHFLTLDNVANGYPNRPRLSKPSPEFVADVKKAFDGIPAEVKRRLESKLAGIYFADDIGGTAFSDQIGKDTKLGFIVLDPTVLAKRTANAWATWKESSPFKPERAWKLTANIEKPADDTRSNAIQYILLHELGHVLSGGENLHPRWTLQPKSVGPTTAFPFYELSWKVAGDRYISHYDVVFPQRKDVVFYFGARLGGAAMLDTYNGLERTNFPTLYAATTPGDDFAEAFANYVHVVIQGKPFEILITRSGQVVKRYGPCWSEARCSAKRSLLEKFLAASP